MWVRFPPRGPPAVVAQPAERRIRNAEVAGPIPADSTTPPQQRRPYAHRPSRRRSLLSPPPASAAAASPLKPGSPAETASSTAGKELIEKLGRRDPCPCGSRRRFGDCCLHSGRFDGVNRNYYFQGLTVRLGTTLGALELLVHRPVVDQGRTHSPAVLGRAVEAAAFHAAHAGSTPAARSMPL